MCFSLSSSQNFFPLFKLFMPLLFISFLIELFFQPISQTLNWLKTWVLKMVLLSAGPVERFFFQGSNWNSPQWAPIYYMPIIIYIYMFELRMAIS